MENLWWSTYWQRVLVTGLCLAAWRLLASFTLYEPRSESLIFFAPATTVVALGLQPYVNALVILTFARMLSRRLRGLSSGDRGLQRLARWTVILTVVVALAQANALSNLLQSDVLVSGGWQTRVELVVGLTAGTMTLVMLGNVIDEHGLGFGNGALVIYALGSAVIAGQRFGDTVLTESGYGDLVHYAPAALALSAAIGIVVATVAVLRSFRPIPIAGSGRQQRVASISMPLVMSGVLRPPAFAGAVLSLPFAIASYLAGPNVAWIGWVDANWGANKVNPGLDALYIAASAALVIGFAYLVVFTEFDSLASRLHDSRLVLTGLSASAQTTHHLRSIARRLSLIGGVFLVFATSLVPLGVFHLTRALGDPIGIDGPDVVLLVAIVLAIAVGVQSPAARGGQPAELRPAPLVI